LSGPYLGIPLGGAADADRGACSITIERGRTLVLGVALPLAGFAPSTTGRFSGVHRGGSGPTKNYRRQTRWGDETVRYDEAVRYDCKYAWVPVPRHCDARIVNSP